MALLLLLYALVILALVGVAIYEHITITTLSLPISPALTILTILLPLLSPLITLTTPLLFHQPHRQPPTRKHTTSPGSSPLSLPTLLPLLLNLAQLTLTTTLTTLFTSTLTSPQITSCLLTNKWSALWQSHNARAIQTIQDALSCCGFRSTRDMAWPFPWGSNPDRGACESQFGRHIPCLPGWEGVLRGAVGGEVAVLVAVGVVQVLSVLLAGRAANTGRGVGVFGGGEENGWVRGLERWIGGGGRERVEIGRRPLLEAAREEGDGVREGYQEVVDEEETPRDREVYESEQVGRQRGTEGYGAVEGAGPRVEPSHHDPWAGV